ncbi:alpha/beta hydrolase [Gemmata sp. JC673]|uniref:Alpha/beta hydrolase n=1 Tax=Gemmata algarum TaxID=2975278 RepID=A0ABU5EYS4_9BACT|nr:alpha/beta fold hydrolase [Gemmata algarum]MDY3560451.1 alpha/beta hydrolase [Gemmata algarum]
MQLLLVHGLGRTPLSLFGLGAALRNAGHHVRYFGYSPTLEPLARILGRLRSHLSKLAVRGHPVGLVGHSLGGILLRTAIPAVPGLRVHHFATLGTPTSVPRMAVLAWNWVPPFRLWTRDCGRFLTSRQAFADLPPITVPFTPIAGTAGPCGRYSPFQNDPNDGVVSVSEAELPGHTLTLFPAVHTWIMDHRHLQNYLTELFTS